MELRPIEKELERRLKSGKDDINSTEGLELFSYYVSARKKVLDEILPEIKAIEKNLTDHSEKHIGNVLDNIMSLIDKDMKRIPCMELYFLCLLALFHDVGNIHGRIGHYDKGVIYKIYDYVRGHDSKFDDEKKLVAEVASKHSGRASDGSSDTIKELNEQKEGLWNKGIDLRKCAAILRFADELAEGRQRTSNFMLLNHKYKRDSLIHHEYANHTTIFISRNDNRIALTYTIKIDTRKRKIWEHIKELLEYIYKRILKLNNERLYTKYYAEVLSNFKKVEVVLNFELNGIPITIGLKQLIVNDLVLPGEETIVDISKKDTSYSVDAIIQKLKDFKSNGK
jgi:hypothetical protein